MEDLFELEPRLKELDVDIRKFEYSGEIVCVDHAWYGCRGRGPRFKNRMLYLVGNLAENPALRVREYYDLAYDHLYNLLPPGPAYIRAMQKGIYG